jgi:hypothetical protein
MRDPLVDLTRKSIAETGARVLAKDRQQVQRRVLTVRLGDSLRALKVFPAAGQGEMGYAIYGSAWELPVAMDNAAVAGILMYAYWRTEHQSAVCEQDNYLKYLSRDPSPTTIRVTGIRSPTIRVCLSAMSPSMTVSGHPFACWGRHTCTKAHLGEPMPSYATRTAHLRRGAPKVLSKAAEQAAFVAILKRCLPAAPKEKSATAKDEYDHDDNEERVGVHGSHASRT